MDIILLTGGLGNQMSQYAFCLAKQQYSRAIFNSYFLRRHKEHQGYELEKIFNITEKNNIFIDVFVRIIRKVLYTKEKKYVKILSHTLSSIFKYLNINIILENPSYEYEEKLLRKRSGINTYIGGWHSEKYYENIKEEIRRKYYFDENRISINTQNVKLRIKKTNSVSIHVRRGDYLTKKNKETFGYICSMDYYHQAILYIKERVSSPTFFVFSDDIEWAKKNIILDDIFYIDCNVDVNSWQDMFLISNCQHNINANSTFSWWGAWLNSNPNKLVIAPHRFIQNVDTPDFYPDSWIKL